MTNIRVKVVHSKNVKQYFKKAFDLSMVSMGMHMQDALYENTHKRTGLLANSWNFRTKDYESGFGTNPVIGTEKGLGPDEKVSEPDKADTLRIGSALIYAEPYNKRFKVLEQTIDEEQGQLEKIASAAFEKVIGK